MIPLLYKNKHYQLLSPKTGKELPSAWLELEAGNHSQALPRGGGWLPSPSSRSFGSGSGSPQGKAPQPDKSCLPSRASSSRGSSAASSLASGREGGRAWLPSRVSTKTDLVASQGLQHIEQ